MKSRLIGDRHFYKQVLMVALPIILQNLITNLVSLLDNVMVGQLDTAQIGAVTIVNNNLLYILNICMFGGSAGAGIFTTQFFGSQDQKGIQYTVRFKLLICILLAVVGCGLCYTFSDSLIGLYLEGDGDPIVREQTLYYGRQYLFIMLLGVLPFAVTNGYASTLRECGQPIVPMIAGMVAMGVNLVGNYILIFGHFGAPQLGVAGAAIATVASRYVEMGILVVWTHLNHKKNPYAKGLFRGFYIPGKLFKDITIKGMPLLLNEAAYTIGMAFLNQCYSKCGLDVVPALSISTTIYNLTATVFRALGNTAGILIGRMLGAQKSKKEIMAYNHKVTAFAVMTGIGCALVTIGCSGLFPRMFNTTDEVRQLATGLIIIASVAMPLQAYIFPVYFVLRAGGKTMITFLFDSGAIWILMLPIAFVLSRFTALSILLIYALCNAMDFFKCLLGFYFVKRGDWVQNLTNK